MVIVKLSFFWTKFLVKHNKIVVLITEKSLKIEVLLFPNTTGVGNSLVPY